MIRISRMADYGVVAMAYIAREPKAMHQAATVAEATGVPLPSASKLLKAMAREGLLISHRGAKGGYSLARAPEEISVATLVIAMDGPISLADCLIEKPGTCDLEGTCIVRGPWACVCAWLSTAIHTHCSQGASTACSTCSV